jgi:formylmethanofuran dehydrogenase subunit E
MLDKSQIKRVLKDHCGNQLLSFDDIAQTLIEHEYEILKKISHKYYSSKYNSKKRYIKALKRYVHFCNKCGEYITKDFGCSNPWCPERIKN